VATCFVIGPIGDRFAPLGSTERETYEESIEVFEKVIVPACSEHDIDPVRADQIAVSGEITEQVFRHLYEDDVVIADVSNGNANVMYELGLRHTRDLLTIQIGEYGQLPFDLEAVRTIKFSRSERGLIDARKQLSKALSVGLSEGGDPVSATRIWLGQRDGSPGEVDDSSSVSEILQQGASLAPLDVDDIDPDGLLERMASAEETFPRLTSTTDEIAALLNDLGAKSEEMGREMEVVNSAQKPTSVRLALVSRFAKTLQGPADELTHLTARFSDDMDEIDGSVNGILEYFRENPESLEQRNARDFVDVLVNMVRSARQGMESLSQFAGVVQNLGSVSKVLRRPGRQMAQSIRTMAQAVALMDEWEAAAVRLVRKKGDPVVLDTVES
jgi:hypothetical protein